MKSRRSRWVSGIGAVLVAGGLVIASYGTGVTPAGAAIPVNPYDVIIAKLDQILAALTSAAGTGNHTLRWDTNNPSASRFTTAFPGAVLDKNTGLVWEQAPETVDPTVVWYAAIVRCLDKEVGGTGGWRLPSVVELKSVQDPSLPAPFVPTSVFTGINGIPGNITSTYWSATWSSLSPEMGAWVVNFAGGTVFTQNKSNLSHYWCVRGHMIADQY